MTGWDLFGAIEDWSKKNHKKLTPEDWFWIGVNGRKMSGKKGNTMAPMRDEAMDIKQFTNFLNVMHKKLHTKCKKAVAHWKFYVPKPPTWKMHHVTWKYHG